MMLRGFAADGLRRIPFSIWRLAVTAGVGGHIRGLLIFSMKDNSGTIRTAGAGFALLYRFRGLCYDLSPA
jgi:hypothetical protein